MKRAGTLSFGAMTIAMAIAALSWSLLVGCTPDRHEVTLFAASSTAPAINEVLRKVVRPSGLTVRTSFVASSTAAKQIERGAPADVFLSASPRWMRYLAQRERLDESGPQDLLSSSLVLVAPLDRPFHFDFSKRVALAEAFEGKLAMGDPEHVPVGIYGRQALKKLGHWRAIAPRLVAALDARAALAFVERGEVDAGLVYRVDALASKAVRIVATLPAASHPRIIYQLALVKGRASAPAKRLRRLLSNGAARRIYSARGFSTLAK